MKISGFKMKKIEKVSIIRENIIPNVILSFLNLISKFINLFAMFFQNYTQRFGYCRRRGFLAQKFNRITTAEPCTNA